MNYQCLQVDGFVFDRKPNGEPSTNSFNNDCNRRLPLGLGPLPELVFNQLGGKGQ